MVGSNVMLTPKGLLVSRRVSRIAVRKASGEGWLSAVNMPRCIDKLDERA